MRSAWIDPSRLVQDQPQGRSRGPSAYLRSVVSHVDVPAYNVLFLILKTVIGTDKDASLTFR